MKPFITALTIATIISSIGISSSFVFASSGIHEAPKLIKTAHSSTVYSVNGVTRAAFPNLSIYQSWYGTDFSKVSVVSDLELAQIPLDKNIIYKTGSLIKIQTDPKVYLVLDEYGDVEWIPSEADFKARGFSFKNIHDVSDALFPDYHLPGTASYFATPQNSAPENQGINTPPQIIAPVPVPVQTPVLTIPDPTITQKTTDTGVTANFKVKISGPGTILFSYAGNGAATSTTALTQATDGSVATNFHVSAGGILYTYRIDATNSDGKTTSKVGSFASYADITVQSLIKNLPVGAALAQSSVIGGEVRVTNNSAATVYMNQFILVFQTVSSATNAPSKTIQIVRLKADGTLGDVVAEKTIAGSVSIINPSNAQKIALPEQLAAGESRDYAIVLKNMDQINIDAASPDDSFSTILQRVDFNSDVSISQTSDALGVLMYKKS